MELRPLFESFSKYEDFCQYYWYRDELIQICKSLGIRHTGSKNELLTIIQEYFKGNHIQPVVVKKSKKNTCGTITLATSILECNFTFSQKMRAFFAETTGQKNFKFTADMVATVKKVKEEKDQTFTLQNLLDVYYGNLEYAKFDSSACQWNQFVKDFCNDPASKNYFPKMKAAAELWSKVRASKEDKIYSSELLSQQEEALKKYKI